jgi:hypothetical protein
MPRPRRGGGGGKISVKSCHSTSLHPLKRPAIVLSSIGREHYTIKNILVGCIRGSLSDAFLMNRKALGR